MTPIYEGNKIKMKSLGPADLFVRVLPVIRLFVIVRIKRLFITPINLTQLNNPHSAMTDPLIMTRMSCFIDGFPAAKTAHQMC